MKTRNPARLVERAVAVVTVKRGAPIYRIAELLFARHERTVRRWIAGESPPSVEVVAWLERLRGAEDDFAPLLVVFDAICEAGAPG